MLMEQTQVEASALPLAGFRDHLRLGTGFADDGVQDGVLETCLRAAMVAVEARTNKALMARDYIYRLNAWRDLGAQVLPVAPVREITALTLVDRGGVETVIAPEKYMLEQDAHRPRLVSMAFVLPAISVGGHADIAFRAGMSEAWDGLPADLRQAVFLLAAHYYEHRHETAAETGGMPFGVAPLIERYRHVRLFGGRL